MPKKPALSARLAFRLPDDVATDWRKRAAAAGVSLSDWVRAQVDVEQATGVASPGRRPARSSFIPADPELLRHLAALGNNVNQIARKMHAATDGVDRVEWLVELAGIRDELRAIREREGEREGGGGDAH